MVPKLFAVCQLKIAEACETVVSFDIWSSLLQAVLQKLQEDAAFSHPDPVQVQAFRGLLDGKPLLT